MPCLIVSYIEEKKLTVTVQLCDELRRSLAHLRITEAGSTGWHRIIILLLLVLANTSIDNVAL